MAIDFNIGNQAMIHAGGPQGLKTATPPMGLLMGSNAVVVSSPMSLLADAAEELTFSTDTTDEFELSERKEKDQIEDNLAKRVELYQQLMHQVGKSQAMKTLDQILRTVRTPVEARKQAERHFPDPSDAWAALSETLKNLEKDGADPTGIAAVRTARDTLEAERGPEIRAGIHGALEAAGYADIDTTDNLKKLYRQTVCEFTSVNEVFARVQEKYGDAGFDRALSFLYASLGADMNTDMPSMEKPHMESVNTSLGQLRLLQSAYAQCERVLDRWENVHGITAAKANGFTSMVLLDGIVAFRNERFLSAMHVERLADRAEAPDIERSVLFLQEMLAMARSFPSSLFDGDAGRMKVLNAVQDAVNAAVAKEDEYLASLG